MIACVGTRESLEVEMTLRSFPPLNANDGTDNPASPCVRNCCLDGDDICLGCGRTLEEIIGWHAALINEKKDILARAEKRLLERGVGR